MHGFDFDELLFKFRYPLLFLFAGLMLVGSGVFFVKRGLDRPATKVEVLNGSEDSDTKKITAEIAGFVEKPGVYKLSGDSRVEDLLILAGGFSVGADRIWTEKYLNRAAKLTDGQKVYIPSVDKQSDSASAKSGGGDQSGSSPILGQNVDLVNINTAGLKELDSLPGIGPAYGQSIIDHRPYSNIEELLSKGSLRKSDYEKIKNLVTVY